MSIEPFQPGDDLVDRAVSALMAAKIPDGPSTQLIDSTRAALADRSAATRNVTAWSADPAELSLARPGTSRLWRWAAIVLLAGSGVGAWQFASRQSAPVAKVTPRVEAPVVAITEQRPERLTGRVRVVGVPPQMLVRKPLVPPSAAGPNCGHRHPAPTDDSLLVNATGGLANVVVSVTAGLPDDTEYPRPPAPAVIDQKDCKYFPHVVAMQTGQELRAKNSDPFLHSVHTNPLANVPVNIAQYTVDPVGTKLKMIKAAETFKVTCDLHPWMTAWVAAFDHPFYGVTNDDGSFDMPALPPGTYTLKAWHERLGSVEQQVTLTYEMRFPTLQFNFGPDRVAAALAESMPVADASAAIVKPCCAKKSARGME